MRYFLTICDGIEKEVSKDEYIQMERFCGFFPKIPDEIATADFGIIKEGLHIKGRTGFNDTPMTGDELISFTECFHTLMRRLNNIAIIMPRKESEKVLSIITQLENLITFPADKRLKKDYEEREYLDYLN